MSIRVSVLNKSIRPRSRSPPRRFRTPTALASSPCLQPQCKSPVQAPGQGAWPRHRVGGTPHGGFIRSEIECATGGEYRVTYVCNDGKEKRGSSTKLGRMCR